MATKTETEELLGQMIRLYKRGRPILFALFGVVVLNVVMAVVYAREGQHLIRLALHSFGAGFLSKLLVSIHNARGSIADDIEELQKHIKTL